MIRAAHSYSTQTEWQQVSSELIAGILEATSDVNVGFLYITDHLSQHAEDIRQRIYQELNLKVVSGTVGLGVCCTGFEFMDQGAAVLLALKLPENSFTEIWLPPEAAPEPLYELEEFPMGIVHSDPGSLSRIIAPQFLQNGFVCGGITASRGPSLQFYSGGSLQGGLSAVAFNEDVAVQTTLSHGCSPRGQEHEITSCLDHFIIELGGEPALAQFIEDLGLESPQHLKSLPAPLQVGIRMRHRDTNEFIVRTLIGYDTAQNLLGLSHRVETGDRLFFAQRTVETTVSDLRDSLKRLSNRLDSPPQAGLYFSCVGRGANLFGESGTEVKIIQEVLGEFPLVGFFGNGEISYEEIHSYSGVLVLFP